MRKPYTTWNRVTVFGRVEKRDFTQSGGERFLNLTLDITPIRTRSDGTVTKIGERLLMSASVLGEAADEWEKSVTVGDLVALEGVLSRIVKRGEDSGFREFMDLRQCVFMGHVPGEWVDEWEAKQQDSDALLGEEKCA